MTPSLRITVVGPISGGSLSVAAASTRAFMALGHTTTFIDNTVHAPALAALRSAPVPDDERQKREVDLFLRAADETQRAVCESQPQLVLYLAQAPVLLSRHTEPLRERDVPSVFWFVEDFRVFTYWQRAAERYDHVWAIQQDPFLSLLRKKGVRYVDFVPLACESPTFANPEGFAAGDITFVGSAYPNRVKLLNEIEEPRLRLFGPGFARHAKLSPLVTVDGVLPHEQLAPIFAQSRINLNLSSTANPELFTERKDFLNPRAFEICAAGGFQLVERLLPLEGFFVPEREVATFLGPEEAVEKLRYFMANDSERRAIAEKGQVRALSHHTYKARLAAALERLMQADGDRVLAASW